MDIWLDPWLPLTYSFKALRKPQLRPNPLHSVHKVSDLIDEDLHQWKHDLVQELFVPDDAESILALPTSSQGIPDEGVWHYTGDEGFTARSAYFLAKSLTLPKRTREKGETSGGNHSSFDWS
ncbi:hypothetical protein Vadar_005335 [Vaccinium darrowii]|uniref:Uncharacterized protein n=1 Tax=Vaccinium darrowii TaxID=229202 RepID=A0ACB7XNS4_9ERIC|nr:hypothetical protein Vadar_005335 [Vaccinium darrowii]